MRVECGDEAVGATVSVDDSHSKPWTRSRDMTVRAHGEHAANYTVPIPPGIHPELVWGRYMHDPQVDCDPSGPRDVQVSVERRFLARRNARWRTGRAVRDARLRVPVRGRPRPKER